MPEGEKKGPEGKKKGKDTAVMATLPERIVIFDYSGTLSLEAPLFGRPESLVRAFRETGLAALGVSTPELFWSGIVNPTWEEGSRTGKGYAAVIAERIAELGLAPAAPRAELAAAASRFVAAYMDHSRIDPHWRPLLKRLSDSPVAGTIIATDHYAEATEAIIGYLADWDIPAIRSGAGEPNLFRGKMEAPFPCVVANSADLGVWKEDNRFWEILKAQLPPGTVRRLLLVDDFGFNEAVEDGYSAPARIAARQEKAAALLRGIFRIEPVIIPFFLEAARREEEDARARLIARTAARCEELLEETR